MDMNNKIIQAYRNGNTEYVEHLIAKGDLSQEKADELKVKSEKSDLENKTSHMKLDKVIELYHRSNESDRRELKQIIDDKYDNYVDSKHSANEKEKMKNLYNQLEK